MFKVLIIDDEPIIRKGLRNIINWKQFDCEICGEAADGLEGSELVKTLKPDIIFTDIKMPEIDGLEMLKEIRDLVPNTKIIILTGYREFNYAQEALKYGAFDYILKPSKIEELTFVVKKAVKELRFTKSKNEEIGKLKNLLEQNIPVLREKLLYDIIYGIVSDEDVINEKLKFFNLNLYNYTLMLVDNEGAELDPADDESVGISQYDSHLYLLGIINVFEEMFQDSFNVTSISLNNNKVAFIIQYLKDKDCYDEIVQTKCAFVQEMILSCFGFTVSIAISSCGEKAVELPDKFKECQQALEHKFYMGNNSIIFFKDLNSFFKCEDYSVLENYQKRLIESIKTGNENLVRDILKELFQHIENTCCISKEYLKNFCWNTASLINNIRVSVFSAENDINEKNKDISGLLRLIEKSDSIAELNEVLKEISLSVVAKVNNFNNKKIKLILKKAVDYLSLHYSEQVTLSEVADYTYVSTYYLSRMFKKELGKNFIDYLNEIRILKAKELLKDPKYKSYEIAEMVGILDAHYFSRLFKKYEGLSPTEYRDSAQI